MSKVFVVDVECTCFEEKYKRDMSDIIQIGVASYDRVSKEIAREANIYVTPTRSSISYFCTELTGLTPELIDQKGVSFKDACAQLVTLGTKKPRWYSCGNYDRTMFETQCRIFNVEYPFSRQHYDVKMLFSRAMHTKKRKGMVNMLKDLGMEIEGRHHDGADDAYNIAKVVKWLYENDIYTRMG